MDSIQRKAEETFKQINDDSLILIAEWDGQPVGYALGRIYNEDETADFDLDDTLIIEIHSVIYLSVLNNKLDDLLEIQKREANGEFSWI